MFLIHPAAWLISLSFSATWLHKFLCIIGLLKARHEIQLGQSSLWFINNSVRVKLKKEQKWPVNLTKIVTESLKTNIQAVKNIWKFILLKRAKKKQQKTREFYKGLNYSQITKETQYLFSIHPLDASKYKIAVTRWLIAITIGP